MDNRKVPTNSYLINGFSPLFLLFKRYLPFAFIDFFPKPSRFDVFTNFWQYLTLKLRGSLKFFKVVHINTWENFLNYSKTPGQIGIGESHGFHFGLNFKETIKHFRGIKYVIAFVFDFFVGFLIRNRIRSFDIYYVSTPNMLPHALELRNDAQWLPNAIDDSIFCPEGEIANLKGNPVIFFPTRLHSFKNPKFGIDLFHKIKKVYPDAVLHLIKYPTGSDYYERLYEKELVDPNTYVWHGFKSYQELASMYRASKIVFGHFDSDLGMMSRVELEAIFCGTAVITCDKYEINTLLEHLEDLTFTILSDPEKYVDYVSKLRASVTRTHSPENVAAKLIADISYISSDPFVSPLTHALVFNNKERLVSIDNEQLSVVGPWTEDNFLYPLPYKFVLSRVVFLRGIVMGYLIASLKEGVAHVHRVAVSGECKGKGLGKKLVLDFLEGAKSLNFIQKITLVTHDTLSVDEFYTKLGFKRVIEPGDIQSFLAFRGQSDSFPSYIGDNPHMFLFELKL